MKNAASRANKEEETAKEQGNRDGDGEEEQERREKNKDQERKGQHRGGKLGRVVTSLMYVATERQRT